MSNTARPLMSQSSGGNPVVQATNPSLPGNSAPNVDTPGTPDASSSSVQHDWEKRYKDLQSYHTKSVQDLKAENARLRSEGVPKFNPPKTAEELSRFKQENPDTYAFIESIAHSIAEDRVSHLSGELNSMKSAQQQSEYDKALAELQRLHPDFLQIDQAPEFHQWLATKSPKVQGWVVNNSDNPEALSAALSMFKQETGWNSGGTNNGASQEVQNQPTGAEFVDNSQGGEPAGGDPRKSVKYIWGESEIAKLHPTEFQKYKADIELAHSEGRISMGR